MASHVGPCRRDPYGCGSTGSELSKTSNDRCHTDMRLLSVRHDWSFRAHFRWTTHLLTCRSEKRRYCSCVVVVSKSRKEGTELRRASPASQPVLCALILPCLTARRGREHESGCCRCRCRCRAIFDGTRAKLTTAGLATNRLADAMLGRALLVNHRLYAFIAL